MRKALFALAPALLLAHHPALAASSDWVEAEGGRVRLVVADDPSGANEIRAALEIELKPGWKTYWREPGDAGIPPMLTPAPGSPYQVKEIGFPAPERFDDGYSVWAGYKHPVALPVTLSRQGMVAAPVALDAFLGICETICIPLQARLEADPAAASGSSRDDALVEAAFAALPEPASPGFGVTSASIEGDELALEIALPEGVSDPELFVAGASGYSFGTPKKAGEHRLSLSVLSRPKAPSAGATIDYTLTAGDRAVQGSFDLR